MLSNLSETARIWVPPLIQNQSPHLQDYADFLRAFTRVFQPPRHAQVALQDLFLYKQGTQDLVAYIAKFRQLAADTDTTESTLVLLFRQGLRDDIKDELTYLPVADTSRELVDQVLQIEARIQERK